MGELASDECIILKRATCCILLRKCRRDRFRALNTNAVYADVEGGQRVVDQCLSQCNDCAANTTWVLLLSTAVVVLEVLEIAP